MNNEKIIKEYIVSCAIVLVLIISGVVLFLGNKKNNDIRELQLADSCSRSSFVQSCSPTSTINCSKVSQASICMENGLDAPCYHQTDYSGCGSTNNNGNNDGTGGSTGSSTGNGIIDNCKSYQIINNNKIYCYQCDDGYTLSNGTCKKNIAVGCCYKGHADKYYYGNVTQETCNAWNGISNISENDCLAQNSNGGTSGGHNGVGVNVGYNGVCDNGLYRKIDVCMECPPGYFCPNGVSIYECKGTVTADKMGCKTSNAETKGGADGNTKVGCCIKTANKYTYIINTKNQCVGLNGSFEDKNKCEEKNNSKTVNNNSSPSMACYIDSTNNYVFGQFDNQNGYTKVASKESNCNNVKIKLVDENRTVIQGGILSFEDNQNPQNNKNINVGESNISMLNPGNYVIKETSVPTEFQLENTPIMIFVNNDGIIEVTGGASIDLGTSNKTRNIDLLIIKKRIASSNTSVDVPVEKKCYVQRIVGIDNEYCYGTLDGNCAGFLEILENKTEVDCGENIGCYQRTDGSYTLGKFSGQYGYQYAGEKCPACYEDTEGTYRWTSEPTSNEKIVSEITSADNCVTPSKSKAKVFLIILIIIVIIAILFVMKSMKKDYNNNSMSDEY